ncbi:BTAD domain-containing putative transcriptional regulator [Streptomyces sp. NPDC058755]|uniref:AfsR/SARP family transcriptional regulator n=1 Tax=unclassified Streptomyces TaxID=2593676 RepID=UPI0036A8428F
MDIGILGPLTVGSEGREAAPSAPKPRQLLALLAARTGHVVPMEVLVDELWEHDPPASAVTVIQTYIVLLRRSLAATLQISTDQVAQDVLPYTGWGYQLSAQTEGAHDADSFARHTEQGRRELGNGDYQRAAMSFQRALQTWRGPALADVRIGPQLLAHRTSLEESRTVAIEQRIEADLHLGRHHQLIGELSGLVIQNPLHERTHSLLMVCQYRAGRPAQALETFRKLHKNLREELGIDPSPHVTKIHQRILSGDVSLLLPTEGLSTDPYRQSAA